jgi:hypothetical protein
MRKAAIATIPFRIAETQNVQRQEWYIRRDPLAIGPICVAQIMNMANNTANKVPVLSKLRSQRSFNIPTPTVKHGPERIPASHLDTAKVVKLLAEPPRIVNTRDNGRVTLYVILRPNTSEVAVASRAPIPRP